MNMKLFLLTAVSFILFACTKTEIETVEGNLAPPDLTVEQVTIENYITRSYILALGREPDETEFNTAFTLLDNAGLDSASRSQFLNTVFGNIDYLPQVYHQNKINLLNNADTSEFTNWINLFNLLLLDSANLFQFPFIQYEIDRLSELQSAFAEFTTGSIGIEELQRRMCNNYLYDQINMGSANFVISTFQNLLNRNPTASEQSAGTSMVDGFNSILFLESGSSKAEYLNIITGTDNYFESQVVFMYLKYLNRVPSTLEMSEGTLDYSSTGDHTLVQKKIMAKNEFIGI